MGLSQHQAAFMEERVNGEILLECDDKVLQEELKVSEVIKCPLTKLCNSGHSLSSCSDASPELGELARLAIFLSTV